MAYRIKIYFFRDDIFNIEFIFYLFHVIRLYLYLYTEMYYYVQLRNLIKMAR